MILNSTQLWHEFHHHIMNMKNLLTFCTLISVNVLSIQFYNIVSSNSLAIDDVAINVIMSCLSNEIRTVGVIASTNYFLSKVISSGSFDVMMIGRELSLLKESQSLKAIPYKLQDFVIRTFSVTDLTHSLENLRSSRWWNFEGRFIIMEKHPVRNYCNNADEYLNVLWKFNIFHGIFICTESSSKVTFFGFNPYNEEAPSPWLLDQVQFNKKFDKHPFTIFKSLTPKEFNCSNIFFEYSSNLNRYPITLNMKNYPPSMKININRFSELVIKNNYAFSEGHYYVKITSNDWHNFHGVDSIIAREFFNFYNATAIIKIYDGNELFGGINKAGEFYGMLKDQKSGDIDVSFNNRFMLSKGDVPLTYPLQQSELTLVAHPRGDMNILMRIMNFLNLKILISIMIICLLSILFFAYFVGEKVQLAVLDTLLLLLGMSLRHIPSSLSPRIFLSCVILFYFIITATVQTNMYTIVTVPQALRNIDSLADLKNLGYKLYTNPVGASMLEPEYYKYLEVIDDDHCIDYLLNQPQAACMDDRYYLVHEAAHHALHLMKKGISAFYLVYPMRKDWPLSQKLNIFSIKFNEAGILKRLLVQSEQSSGDAIRLREQKYKLKKFHVMTLRKCNSVFFLWMVGTLISIIVFFLECKIFRYCQKYQNKPIYIWYRQLRIKNIKVNFLHGCR